MHKKLAKQGLSILGFPCNQFGNQEPGTDSEIKTFCTGKYDVGFDMFAKVNVNGPKAAPFYKYLTKQVTMPKVAGKVSWNFEKFVIDRKGKVIGRFGPRVAPNDPAIQTLVKQALAAK